MSDEMKMMDGYLIGGDGMKRRVIKKWINRYITPLINGLPKTVMAGWEIDKGNGEYEYHQGKNHSIKNGYIVDEGCVVPPSAGLRKDIIRAASNIQYILHCYNHVYIRVSPTVEGERFYMRIITEKVNT